MWSLTDERQITEIARALHSPKAPWAAISPVFLSSAAQQNPLDAPTSSSSSCSRSPGLWCGSCLLTKEVSRDELRCKHSISPTEVCRVRVRVFSCPFSATAPRHQRIECGAVLTAECLPLCLPNKGSLSLPLMDDSFFLPPYSRVVNVEGWAWDVKMSILLFPLFPFKGTFSAVEEAHLNLPRAASEEVFVHSAMFRQR